MAQEAPLTPGAEPAAVPANPYALPAGATAEQLVEFMGGILQQPPPNAEAREKAIAALLEASGKILAGNPSDEQAEFAVTWRMRLLGDPAKLEAMVVDLEKAGRANLARMVRGQLFSQKLRMAVFGPRENLLKLLGEIRTYIASAPLDGPAVGLAFAAGQAAEMSGDEKLAADTYEGFASMFAESDNPQIVELAGRFRGIIRRLKLPGNPIKLDGKLLDGTPLDWSQYEGKKVVLIDFWATWCGPCVAELPNMKKVYEQYRDKGFEILGISLDNSREDLEQFLAAREIPWPIVYGDEGPSPTVDYYGVMSIPTMILVGADGKVISTRARGEALQKHLAELLGPVEENGLQEGLPLKTE